MTRAISPKQKVLEDFLEKYHSVFVHVDTRRSGVMLPPEWMNKTHVTLQIGLDLVVPLRDLTFDHEGWSGTLSFNRSPFFCIIPWTAMFGVISDQGVGGFWQGDLPPELVAERCTDSAVQTPPSAAAAEPAKLGSRRVLKSVPAGPKRENKKIPKGWGVIEGGKK